jgi:acetyl-CoA carboxylase beta subunit
MDEFEKRRKTCPSCNYHARLSWKERLEITADKDSFQPFDERMNSLNPIGFPEYEKKIKSLQEANDINDAIEKQMNELRTCQSNVFVSMQMERLRITKNLIGGLPDCYPMPMTKN